MSPWKSSQQYFSIGRHFRDESLQALNCTGRIIGTDKKAQTKIKTKRQKNHKINWSPVRLDKMCNNTKYPKIFFLQIINTAWTVSTGGAVLQYG